MPTPFCAPYTRIYCILANICVEITPERQLGTQRRRSEASRHGHLVVARVLITLIDNGANMNTMQQTHCQWTLIHVLAEHENLRLLKILFERGANVHAMNDQGKTPYQLSLQRRRGHREMVDHRLSPEVWHVKKKVRRHPFLAWIRCLTDTSILAVDDIERSQLFKVCRKGFHISFV